MKFEPTTRVVKGVPADKKNALHGEVVQFVKDSTTHLVVRWDAKKKGTAGTEMTVEAITALVLEKDFDLEADFAKLKTDVLAKFATASSAIGDIQKSLEGFYGKKPKFSYDGDYDQDCEDAQEQIEWVKSEASSLIDGAHGLGYYLGWSSSSFAC